MKKILCLLLCVVLIVFLTACRGEDEETPSLDGNEIQEHYDTEAGDAGDDEYENVDLDLTIISGTMVYSLVYNLMVSPDEYIGKVIKMNGMFSHFYDEEKHKHYYACIIQDATACCSQGIEFVPTEEFANPEERLEEGEEITVVGVLEPYSDGEYKYLTLKDAKLV